MKHEKHVPAAYPRPRRFIALDGLRGIGALLVIFGHYNGELWLERDSFIFSSSAYLVVDIFFLLSGFVLAHAFYDKPDFGFWHFVKRRAFRLWPLHLATLAAFALIMYFCGDPIDGQALLLNILLLHNVGIGDWVLSGFNYPSWSLSVELAANLVVAGIILAIPDRRLNTLVLAMVSLCCAALLFFTVPNLNLHTQNLFGFVNTGLLRCFITFPMGILAYRLFTARRSWFEHTSWLHAVFIGALIAGILATLCLPGQSRKDLLYLGFYGFAIMFLASPGPFWTAALGRLRWLGDISFAVYLVHMVVLKLMKEIPFWPHDYLTGLIIAWCLSIALGALAHYMIERPCYSRLTRHTRRSPRAGWKPAMNSRSA